LVQSKVILAFPSTTVSKLTLVAAEILEEEIAAQVEQLSLQIYQVASDYARSKGIIIADVITAFLLSRLSWYS